MSGFWYMDARNVAGVAWGKEKISIGFNVFV
jgi:hypothetical protein